jgi:hypothetical protein
MIEIRAMIVQAPEIVEIKIRLDDDQANSLINASESLHRPPIA